MIIPQDLDHLDVLSPEVLNDLILRELLKNSPDLQFIQACINAGAPLDIKNKWGSTVLDYAADKGHPEVVQVLITAGADLDVQNECGWTALHYAASRGHLEMAKALITAGASLDVQDENGWTALHGAVYNRHLDIIRLLIKAGAAKDVRTVFSQQTPWNMASLKMKLLCFKLRP